MDFFLLNNSNNYRVEKLRNETGALVSDATIELTIRQRDEVTGNMAQITAPGITWPLEFVAEGKGDYRVHLPADLPLLEGVQYQALITGLADGRVFEETRSLFAKRRLTV